jgi:hypothetical protein
MNILTYDCLEAIMEFCEMNTIQQMRLACPLFNELGIAELRRRPTSEQVVYYQSVLDKHFKEWVQDFNYPGIAIFRTIHCSCGSTLGLNSMAQHEKTKRHIAHITRTQGQAAADKIAKKKIKKLTLGAWKITAK